MLLKIYKYSFNNFKKNLKLNIFKLNQCFKRKFFFFISLLEFDYNIIITFLKYYSHSSKYKK